MSGKKGKKLLNDEHSERQLEDYFEEVYREYFDRLFSYALVIMKSESSAKDVVGDVFYHLWNAKTDLFSIRELKSYLFTSVKNQAIRSLSSDPLHFHTESYEHNTSSIDQIDPEDLLMGKELDEFLHRTISALPDQCGLVFKMVKEHNLKYEQVAMELGISVDTVKYHLKTALKKIRAGLEDHFDDSPVIRWFSTGTVLMIIPHVLSLLT